MSGSSIRLVPMRWWHIAPAHALEQQLFPVDAWTAEQFWSELAQPTRQYVAALDEDGSLLGYAGLFVLQPVADVQTIAVGPAAQGRGLGARLLTELIDRARTAGAEQLLLEVRADNAAALALYARFGFAVLTTRRDYYAPGADALVMRLRPLPPAPAAAAEGATR